MCSLTSNFRRLPDDERQCSILAPIAFERPSADLFLILARRERVCDKVDWL